MRGVNKCVVEIVEPKDENIERVLVFFKPESRAVKLGKQKDSAEKYVSGLVSWHKSWLPAKAPFRMIAMAAVLAAALAAAWLIF